MSRPALDPLIGRYTAAANRRTSLTVTGEMTAAGEYVVLLADKVPVHYFPDALRSALKAGGWVLEDLLPPEGL